MKYNSKFCFCYLLAASFFIFSCQFPSQAKKEKPIDLSVVNNDGEKTVNGSVLNPNHDEIHVLMLSLLNALKRGDIKKVSIIIASIKDATQTFVAPNDSISIQKKKIKTKTDKYLVVNLFNLSTSEGTLVSPSALPSGEYKLKIKAGKSTIETGTFNYEPPALIVGKVDTKSTGLVSIEDLEGKKLSERTVATNPDGTFFTEVRANKIPLKQKIKNQTLNAKSTGVIHAITEKDLLAVVPLDNNVQTNAQIASSPISVTESSTLTAQIARNNQPLAFEIVDEITEKLKSGESLQGFDLSKVGCNITQFFNRCPEDLKAIENFELLESIGKDFIEFIKTANCNFPGFEILKELVTIENTAFVESLIAIDYCKTSKAIIGNALKPCNAYVAIQKEFEGGIIEQLPCPPPFCEEFKDIKPPKCFTPINFCEEAIPSSPPSKNICRGPKCFEEFFTNPCIQLTE